MYASMSIGFPRMNSDLSFAKGVNCAVRYVVTPSPPSITPPPSKDDIIYCGCGKNDDITG